LIFFTTEDAEQKRSTINAKGAKGAKSNGWSKPGSRRLFAADAHRASIRLYFALFAPFAFNSLLFFLRALSVLCGERNLTGN
jgi:hypothetical protein